MQYKYLKMTPYFHLWHICLGRLGIIGGGGGGGGGGGKDTSTSFAQEWIIN